MTKYLVTNRSTVPVLKWSCTAVMEVISRTLKLNNSGRFTKVAGAFYSMLYQNSASQTSEAPLLRLPVI